MKHTVPASSKAHRAELNYNKLTPILQKNYTKTLSSEEIKILIEEAKTFEKVNNDENKIVGLFHFNNFTLSYLSQNAALKFECPIIDGKITNDKALFYGLDESHNEFPHKAFEWIETFMNNFTAQESELKNAVNYFCGVKFKNKDNEVRSYFIRQHIRTHSETGLPCTCVCFLTDITHLYKADFYWARMVRGKHKEITTFRISNNTKEHKDIITPREKQILQLISSKKESKEISRLLNITLNTVDSHRKAMIKRSGTQNTTALVQLCKMAGVL